MTPLRIVVLLLDAYLLVGILPWVLARALDWYLTRGAGAVLALERDLQRLREAVSDLEPFVRETPRPGPFAGPDRRVVELARRLEEQIGRAEKAMPALRAYEAMTLSIPQALLFGGLKSLRRIWPVFRAAWSARELLLAAEDTRGELLDQIRAAQDIPRQAEGQIRALEAEQQRLIAVLDAEREAGTHGLEGLRQRLHEVATTLEAAERHLREAAPDDLPTVLEELGVHTASIADVLQQLDERVEQVVAQRQASEKRLERAASAVGLLSERWEGMRARGAKDLKVSHALHALGTHLRALEGQVKLQTVESLQALEGSFGSFEERYQEASERLDLIDGLLSAGHDRLRQAEDALARAEHRLRTLQRDHPNLVADESTAAWEAAREVAAQAQEQFAKGTEAELGRAAEMATGAAERAERVAEAAEALPKIGRQVRELHDAVAPAVVLDKMRALEELRASLKEYPQHWEDGLVERTSQAQSLLEACQQEREKLPEALAKRGVLVQSQVGDIQQILGRAIERLNEASDLIAELERERDHILAQRDEVERRIEAIRARLVPDIERVREALLPELAQRYEALQPLLTNELRGLEDPRQTHYGRAVSEELPALERQLFELREAHQESVRYYRDLLEKAVRDSERTWARLQHLDPMQSPRPEADLEQLAQDMRAWRQEATANEENPRVLQELVGRRAAALMRRIESVAAEVEQGRADLASLASQYESTKTQVLQLRTAIHELGRQGDWGQILWDTELADGAWQRAQELEREATSSATLPSAVNALQRAVTAAGEAERLYGDLHSEMTRALSRLDREWQIASTKLGRAARRQHSLEERQHPEDAREIAAVCDSARRAMELARAATTFEDAFRHLRDAHNHLLRL
ncbi:MAG: hypothetical protein ACP5G7_00630 [Anaerolineae bacterium]